MTLGRRLVIGFFLTTLLVLPHRARACGHDGFYLGAGYQQQLLYTPEHQLTTAGGTSSQIHFGPAIGGHFLLGYDQCGTRWGVQFPFDYAYVRLNREENVHLFGSGIEAIFHVAAWEEGLDVHLLGGGGWEYMTEGSIDNQSASFGLYGAFGPGLSWYFARDRKVTGALTFDLPLRAIVFFDSRLSANKTTVIAIPLRVGLSVGF